MLTPNLIMYLKAPGNNNTVTIRLLTQKMRNYILLVNYGDNENYDNDEGSSNILMNHFVGNFYPKIGFKIQPEMRKVYLATQLNLV